LAIDGRLLSGATIFTAAVEAGSIARAGERLGLTASGVSRAISRLEHRLGVVLLVRGKRGIRLTSAGRSFHDGIGPAMDAIGRAATVIAENSASVRGRLRVAVDTAFGQLVLAPRLFEFLDRYPDLELDLKWRNRFRSLDEDDADVAARFGPVPASNMIVQCLFETRVLTCASPGYLKRKGEVSEPDALRKLTHECVLYNDPSTGRPFRWDFHRGGVNMTIDAAGRLVVDDVGGLIGACLSGHGIAQLLRSYSSTMIADGRLVQLLSEWGEERYPLNVVYSAQIASCARIKAFVRFATDLGDDRQSTLP
jgi:DNA-binding transcriptional LysR family regulator